MRWLKPSSEPSQIKLCDVGFGWVGWLQGHMLLLSALGQKRMEYSWKKLCRRATWRQAEEAQQSLRERAPA